MTTTYTQVSPFTTVVTAELRSRRGYETFTIYQDAETKPFVSYHKTFSTKAEAESYASKLIAKFIEN